MMTRQTKKTGPHTHRPARAAGLILSLALLAALPQPLSAGAPAAFPLEATIFLGQAVPLRLEGVPIAELLRERFGGIEGELEVFQTGTEGALPLEELGRCRPAADEDYRLSAVLHTGDGRDIWKSFPYRVRVIRGTVRVRVEGSGLEPEAPALFQLEGQGLTLYRQASLEADPQGGPPRLEASFDGLPYGVYQATALPGGQTQTALLGVCETDDTISTARSCVTLRFDPAPAGSGAISESYRLEAAP